MPIQVECANCRTWLGAPDAAAGRKIRCPKCQAIMPIPATAPPAPEAPPAGGRGGAFNLDAAVTSAGPSRGRDRGERGDRGERRRRDDDPPSDRDDRPRRPRPRDDDPAEDDRPSRGSNGRGKRGGSKKSSPVILIALVGGLVFLTCCGGGGYFAWDRIAEVGRERKARNDALEKQLNEEREKLAAGGGGNPLGGSGKMAVPVGWKEFRPPDGSFKAYFPALLLEPEDAPPFPPPAGKKLPPAPAKGYSAGGRDLFVMVLVVKFPAEYTPADRDRTMDDVIAREAARDGPKIKTETRETTWLGRKCKEGIGREVAGREISVLRYTVLEDTGYVAVVRTEGARREDIEKSFFETFEAQPK
ncbi:MAG TPA: hypothetical protein VH092_07570 [Urbifossiella sp.]|nr:hypothetical protein [Urbifossiella sp.]